MSGAQGSERVVVTGGSGGLGRGVVPALLTRGASVVVPVFDGQELDGTTWRDDRRVTIIDGVDLTREASVRDLYGAAGPVTASVHLVGGFAMAPLVDTTSADVESMFHLNAMTALLCTREASRVMLAAGRGGRIVNVAARPALSPVGGMIAYAMSKAAVVALTQSAAEELRGAGILVNAVAPSIMDTPANRAAMPEADHSAWPSVEDVASAIAFLASPDNALTSGLVMPVYGRV